MSRWERRIKAAAEITFITILALAAILVWANRADAAPDAQRDLAIAQQYWGAAIPGYAIEVAPLIVVDAGRAGESMTPGTWMRIDPTFWSTASNRHVCVLVVHEYGHSTGHNHVSVPTNVMYETPAEDSVPGCNAAYPSLQETMQAQTDREAAAIGRTEARAEAANRKHKHRRHHHAH